MGNRLRQVHAATSWLFVVTILIQVFLAGTALADLGGSGDFRTHAEFGYSAVGIVALAVVLTAVLARPGRRDLVIALGLLFLYIVQTTLPSFRSSSPIVAALHPVNALLLFGLAAWYAWHASRTAVRSGIAEPQEDSRA